MENTIPNQGSATFQPAKELPGSTGVLVLGILSLVLMGIIGIILAIIAISKANGCKAVYEMDPSAYTQSSYKNMKGGRICAIVSLSILGGLIVILLLAVLIGNM